MCRTWAEQQAAAADHHICSCLTFLTVNSDINIWPQDAMDEYNKLKNIKKVAGLFLHT